MRFLISAFILILATSGLQAQIKIEGPKQVSVGTMVKLKLTQFTVDDPQFKSSPANDDDWIAVRDFEGNAWIIYTPSRKSLGTAKSLTTTFIISGSKAGKTYLETFEVTATSDGSAPDPVKPDELFNDLRAKYLTSPSVEAKLALIGLLQTFADDIKADKFASNKEAHEALKVVGKKYLGTNIQPLRDAIGDYFVTKAGTSGAQFNKEKLSTAVNDVIVAVKKIPD